MPADERIKVIFKSLYVSNGAAWTGSGEFYFKASVDGTAVGDPAQIFDGKHNTSTALDETKWSAVVDVTNKANIQVRFHGYDKDAFFDDLGSIEHTLNPPWTPRDYRQVTWSWTAVAGGSVDFVGPPTGLKVLVYGTAAGEVLLTVKYKGAVAATYRALVMNVKQIPARFNIFKGQTVKPLSTPAHVVNHVKIANRYLRQVGIELVFDTDSTVKDGAVAVAGYPGIFRVPVIDTITRGVHEPFPPACRMNFRDFVANFAYVHSDQSSSTLGRATHRQASKAGATITDSGTPSSSWILPSGIAPDAAAGTVTMNLRPALLAPAALGVPTTPNLFAMYLTNANGDPAADEAVYANTLAHEFGHILNLAHRPQVGGDGLPLPLDENLMHPTNPPLQAQDLDIIQARAVHQSPLVPP